MLRDDEVREGRRLAVVSCVPYLLCLLLLWLLLLLPLFYINSYNALPVNREETKAYLNDGFCAK